MISQIRISNRKIYFLAAILLLVQLACQAVNTAPTTQPGSQSDLPTARADSPVPTSAPSEATEAPVGLQPTAPPPATPRPAGSIKDLACFGTSGKGMTCLSTDGWRTYTTEFSEIVSNYVDDLVVCGDKLAVPTSSGISLFDGSRWSKLEGWGIGGVSGLGCASENSIWVAHFQGLSYYDGSSWSTHDNQSVIGSTIGSYEDLLVTPDGRTWVLTSDGVAMYDGAIWTYFTSGQGFDDQRFFKAITSDAQGRPWVAYSQGVAVFEGGEWLRYKNAKLNSVEDLAVDGQGRVWAASFSDGLFVFENEQWTTYNTENSDLSSNKVRSVAADQNGRIWVGTSWGLHIIDGESWQTYRMDNSGLSDQDIRSIAVAGVGPTLPEPEIKEPGSISGRLVYDDGSPVANAVIEICVEAMGSIYYGDTPCSDQPFMLGGMTDADGNFTISGVPVGFYILTVQTPTGWAQLVGFTGVFSERVLVEPGKNSDVEEITVDR